MRRHIILGANGHVGSAVAETLLQSGEAVTVVIRAAGKAAAWEARGARAAAVDVGDPDALRSVLRTGTHAFLLNPPAPVTGDTDAEERRTAQSIAEALAGSGLQQVVAQSTYGAQPGEAIGDLSVLYEFEQALRAQSIPATIQRAAYFFSNWDAQADAVRETGKLASFFPADMIIPMVAPQDLGRAAARLLCDAPQTSIHHVEGPDRYSPDDVAQAFGTALGRTVTVDVIPPARWEQTYRSLGFSAQAARAFTRMMDVNLKGVELPEDYERGQTTLDQYVHRLCTQGDRAR